MAYYQKKTNAKGETVYKIKISCGYTKDGKQITHTKTWIPPKRKMTEKKLQEVLAEQAVLFRKEIENGITAIRTAKFEAIA